MNRQFITEIWVDDEDYQKDIERLRELEFYPIEEHDIEARNKTIDEMAQTIRKIESDTTHCLFDCPKADEPITCTICTLEKAIKQMKGEEDNENETL